MRLYTELRSHAFAPVLGAGARYALTGLAFVAAYVALDWVSFLNDYSGLGITPWNPQPGLTLAFLLRLGLGYAPWLWLAAFTAELVVRGVAAAPGLLFIASALIAATYSVAAWILARRLRIDPALSRLRDVVMLLVVGGSAALCTGGLYVGLFHEAGAIPSVDLAKALLRFVVGDFVGIAVTTPALLLWLPPGAEARDKPLFLACGIGAVLLVAWLVFGLRQTDEFKFFYLLFLPVVAVALRSGLAGASLSLVAAELATVMLLHLRGFNAEMVTELQALMLSLTVVGILSGAVVSERFRIQRAFAASERTVRERQTELAHIARLATTGEMATQLAHELTQPLSALRTYTRAADTLLDERAMDIPRARQAMADAVAQADRAGAIIRRLREFVRKREVDARPGAVAALIEDAVALVSPEAARHGIELRTAVSGDMPPVRADAVQIAQVLVNLLRNAIDATAAVSGHRLITIGAERNPGYVAIIVRDTGRGVPRELRTRLFEPFATDKPDGMGLGLSISRSIVEAHGGRLWLAASDAGGTEFRFTLPCAEPADG